MQEIERLNYLFRLKEIDRTACGVKNREESTAEHTYSVLMLSQYFLPKITQKLDHLKVMRMLLVHDIVEIEAGDTYLYDDEQQIHKEEREKTAFETLLKQIPPELAPDFKQLWHEFEENTTPEAKFCKAIDKLDPIIHSAFNKRDWDTMNITEETLRKKKEAHFEEFPAIHAVFNKWVEHAKQKGYLKQQ